MDNIRRFLYGSEVFGCALHVAERVATTLGADVRNYLPITYYLGNISVGALSVLAADVIAESLFNHDKKLEKAIKLAIPGFIFLLTILMEKGVIPIGTPDLWDVPGAALGVLGFVSLTELQNKRKTNQV